MTESERAIHPSPPPLPLLVVVLGPTASGKTALSLALAARFHGEVVNCDSVAVYRDFKIGTAKPTTKERALVPHHLLDIVSPIGPFTAGDYSRIARTALHQISQRGVLPIVVGGSGLYLRALLEGLFAGPPRSEELRQRLRQRAAERGAAHLHSVLLKLDPESAAKIHPNDLPKLVRAIEVCLSARQRMSDLWQRGRDPLIGFRVLRLGLDPERSVLYERINDRARRMFAAGLVEETRQLHNKYGDTAAPLASLGYKQAMQFIRGEMEYEQAVAAAQQAHRNYAKRQMTWFRREPDVHWFNSFGDDPQVQSNTLVLVENHLKNSRVVDLS
ncbi:MAG TPA: tRNA (adenosine(37)-N6)-dimethylallyltransferase MiaA [Terriglobales bacterium]|jgi:tRNA dimethylallyltransferase|nr:tRNA (adenosine(37)-N6)-dimethylallyltransferase MiaA [Terriglobales bacterium]